jgi:cytochrome c oxidase subunit 4
MANETHSHHHILSLGLYLKIGSALLVLTVVTVWVAQYDLGALNLLVAMIIAVAKGTLVALFFMHLKYTNKLYATVFVGALLMVAVFIILTMFDTLGRGQIYEIKDGPINSRAVIYQQDSIPATQLDSIASTVADTTGVDSAQ